MVLTVMVDAQSDQELFWPACRIHMSQARSIWLPTEIVVAAAVQAAEEIAGECWCVKLPVK